MQLGTKVFALQPGVLDRLSRHLWKGNVRELENILVEAVVRARGKAILLEELEEIIGENHSAPPVNLESFSLPLMEREHIQKTLKHVEWNRSKAARLLGISLPTLRSKIRKYSITPSEGIETKGRDMFA